MENKIWMVALCFDQNLKFDKCISNEGDFDLNQIFESEGYKLQYDELKEWAKFNKYPVYRINLYLQK